MCENLSSVELSESIQIIDENAFSSCPKLSQVKIPNSVTSINSSSFDEKTKLTGNTDVFKDAQEKSEYEANDKFDVLLNRYPQGWNTQGGKRFYKRKDGTKQTGWMDLNGRSYYFYSNGVQATGFINLN